MQKAMERGIHFSPEGGTQDGSDEQRAAMSDVLLGAIMGALAMCAVAMAATKLQLIHIGLKAEREPEQVQPAGPPRKYPRIKSTVTVEAKNELSSGLRPQVRLFATVENEGEMVVRSLRGYWKVVTQDKYKHPTIKIQREVFASQDKYLESYLLEEMDTYDGGVGFDVEMEFDYMAESDHQNRHYTAKYRYDNKHHRMIKL